MFGFGNNKDQSGINAHQPNFDERKTNSKTPSLVNRKFEIV